MGKTLAQAARAQVGITGSPSYSAVVGRIVNDTTENDSAVPVRTAGTADNLQVGWHGFLTGPSSVTVAVRVNGATGNETVTFDSTVTGFAQDTTHTDSLSAGDKLNFIITGGTSPAPLLSAWAVRFTVSGSTVAIVGTSGSSSTTTASSTQTVNGAGQSGLNTESQTQNLIPAAATLQNMAVYVSANSRTTTTTFKSRINGTNGNAVCSYGSTATGLVEDTTHTDSLSANDLLNWALTTLTGTQNITFRFIKAELVATSWPIMNNGGALFGAAASTYTAALSGYANWITPGSPTEHKAVFVDAVTLSQLWFNASANTRADSTTIDVYDVTGAAGTALTVTLGAGATGTFQDTTHTVAAPANEAYSLRCVFGAGAGQLTLWGGSLLVGPGSAVGAIDGVTYPTNVAKVGGLAQASIAKVDGLA